MSKVCQKCGGSLEAGFATREDQWGLGNKEHVRQEQQYKLLFVVNGIPTANNPVQAFKQGLVGEPANRVYSIVGSRCIQCGALELYAENRDHSTS